jgi:two-component system chemotaxis response regulator CheB
MAEHITITQNSNEVAGDTDIPKRIIVIGASTGGFEVFKKIIQELPANFDSAIFIVWHMAAEVNGILPQVLNKYNTIYAGNALDKELIKPNRIYVAPPDHHLIIEEGRVRITQGPKENRFRPAIDPLFRSAAYTYRDRVIGVVLSGGMDDGTAGLWRIKQSGGITIVQDPYDAEVPSMPQSALREVEIDHTVAGSEIAALLIKLSQEQKNDGPGLIKDEKTKSEIDIAAGANAYKKGSLHIGELSPFTCPECDGVLSKITEGDLVRFRCHTGHAYSSNTLLALLIEKTEQNLYSALRNIDEEVMLLNHFGDHYAEANMPGLAADYFKKAMEAEERIDILRRLIVKEVSEDKLIKDTKMKM